MCYIGKYIHIYRHICVICVNIYGFGWHRPQKIAHMSADFLGKHENFCCRKMKLGIDFGENISTFFFCLFIATVEENTEYMCDYDVEWLSNMTLFMSIIYY